MERMVSYYVVVILVLMGLAMADNVPMSPCKLARATWYPIARNSTTKLPQGTCGFGTVASSMPAFFQNGYVSAPDDETYNGYPFLSPPITITTGGVGRSCGECFEITGPRGRIIVMSADVCDKKCCSNCQGTTGNDVQNFDIDNSTWLSISETNGGNVVIAYRKVSCDIANPLSFFFNPSTEGTPQGGYFRMRAFNQIVGVAAIEVKGSAAGGTKGNWVQLQRDWVGSFNWSNRGDIGAPFQVRMTSILGDVVTFPQSIQASDLSPGKIFSSGTQFPAPVAGYGNSTSAACYWPGPNTTVFDDKQEGLSVGNLIFRDWGSSPALIFNSTNNPHSGSRCIDAGMQGAWGMIQLGYQTPFPSSMFTGFSFWLRSDGAIASYSNIKVAWKYNGASSASSGWLTLGKPVTSTWQLFQFSMSNFTSLPAWINVLMFQNTQGTSSGVKLYFDDIKFAGGNLGGYY